MILLFVIVVLISTFLGYEYARSYGQTLLMLLYHVPYRFLWPYERLYDTLESTFTYEMIGRKKFKTKQAFLGHFAQVRPQAGNYFKKIWRHYTRLLMRPYGIILGITLPLLFVWWLYVAFIVPFVFAHIIYCIYSRVRLKHDAYLSRVAMVEMIIGFWNPKTDLT